MQNWSISLKGLELTLHLTELCIKWTSMKTGATGWERIGLALHPEWRSCWNWEMYHGIVRRSGLRIGKVGLYRFWLRSSWPLPTCDERPCWHDLRDDEEYGRRDAVHGDGRQA